MSLPDVFGCDIFGDVGDVLSSSWPIMCEDVLKDSVEQGVQECEESFEPPEMVSEM